MESFRKNVFIYKTKDLISDKDGNTFIRKGIIGAWKNYFNKDMNKEWNATMEKQLLTSDFAMVFQWICYKNNNINCTKNLVAQFIWYTVLYPRFMTTEKLVCH